MLSTTANSTRKLSRWISLLLVAVMISSASPLMHAKKQKPAPAAPPKPKKEFDTSRLVWPQPPDIARIKYMTQLFGEDKPPEVLNASQKRKKGWMDRLAGVQTDVKASPSSVNHVFGKPYGVAVDSKGRIYVADTYVGAVFIYDQENHSFQFIRNGYEGRFRTMIGVAVDDNGRVFVSDADMKQVSVFSPEHKLEAIFGNDYMGRPSGMALDVENRFLYVVDAEKETVFVIDADTLKKIRTIGGPPKKDVDEDPGVFSKPTNAAVDKEGNVYVADTINNRIQIFDADGQFVSMFGRQGDGPGFFERPKGVAIDADGHIWVVDAGQHRVQIFNRDGHLLGHFGGPGYLPGQFGLPTGIAIDSRTNRVIVAEQVQGRVQIFRYFTEAEVATEKAEREKKASASTATPPPPDEEVKK